MRGLRLRPVCTKVAVLLPMPMLVTRVLTVRVAVSVMVVGTGYEAVPEP